MLGFNDCLYSCVFDTAFNINSVITDYISTIDALIKDYPDFTFYICSINPIDCDYPFVAHKEGAVPKNVLTEKIVEFNTKMKEKYKDKIFFKKI